MYFDLQKQHASFVVIRIEEDLGAVSVHFEKTLYPYPFDEKTLLSLSYWDTFVRSVGASFRFLDFYYFVLYDLPDKQS